MKKRRIIQIVGDKTLSGIGRHTALLSAELKKRGHKVKVIAPPGPVSKFLQSRRIPTETVAMRSPFDRRSDHAIRDIIRASQADIVHCQGLNAGWLGRLAARKLPQVTMVYNEYLWTEGYHMRNRVWEDFVLRAMRVLERYTDMTVAVSRAVKKEVVKKRLAPVHKIAVVPSMLDPRFERVRRYPKPKEVPQVIGTVGPLNTEKGLLITLEALKILNERHPKKNWRYHIIGRGPLEKAIRRRIRRYRLGGRVVLIPRVDDMVDTMRHFSYYIHNAHTESFTMSLMEAMSLGVPPVVSDRGALREMVKNKATGLVVPYGSATKLAEALIKLMDDEVLYGDLSAAARQAALDRYRAKLITGQVELVYERAYRNRHFASWRAAS